MNIKKGSVSVEWIEITYLVSRGSQPFSINGPLKNYYIPRGPLYALGSIETIPIYKVPLWFRLRNPVFVKTFEGILLMTSHFNLRFLKLQKLCVTSLMEEPW